MSLNQDRQPLRQPQPQRQQFRRRPLQRRPNGNRSRFTCVPCDISTDSCSTSVIFTGFLAFYLISFLWDVFVVRAGFLSLNVAQRVHCVERVGLDDINPQLILVLLFTACFHAIALVWIIGFMHSKQVVNGWIGGELVDVPRQWPRIEPLACDWAIVVPFSCYQMLMIIQFGLSFHIYLFLEDLIEYEPEAFVERFCVGYEETEEAFEWMQISLFMFIGSFITGCIYCCLMRIATNDVSIFEPGQQRIYEESE